MRARRTPAPRRLVARFLPTAGAALAFFLTYLDRAFAMERAQARADPGVEFGRNRGPPRMEP